MKMTGMKKMLSAVLCLVLIAAMALSMTACGSSETTDAAQVSFTFVVVDTEGNETTFDISTDKTIVGEALLEQELIAGEDGEYGLYVTTVNGITLDWEKDQKYWAFYVDGEYAMTGVDTTEIVEGSTYSFKAE